MARGYDVVVLGAGNAGLGAAGVTRDAGRSVAVIEAREAGGTCPLRGCVPKKVLVAAAQALHQIELAAQHHISAGPAKVDWAGLIARERSFVEGVPADFKKSLESRGIDLIEGCAAFAGPQAVAVNGETLNADKVVIATGSKTRPLPIRGAEHMITSDDILLMKDLPESLAFIGGGVIALEFSHVFQRAGCQVTILEATPQLLPRLDPDAVAKLRTESERIGIKVLTDVKVASVEKSGRGVAVAFEHDGKEQSVTVACVANGTGRVADLDGLDLEAGRVAHDGSRVLADEYLCSTSNPNVYVTGDALSSSAQLSPIATYEGRIAGHNIVQGNTRKPEYIHIPSCVFTVPALASVGYTEAEARDKGLDFDVKANDMRGWRSSRTHGETVAFAKTLVERGSGKILGAHLVGHGAEEVIHTFAFAMKHGITATELAETVFAYPTFTSDVKFMV